MLLLSGMAQPALVNFAGEYRAFFPLNAGRSPQVREMSR